MEMFNEIIKCYTCGKELDVPKYIRLSDCYWTFLEYIEEQGWWWYWRKEKGAFGGGEYKDFCPECKQGQCDDEHPFGEAILKAFSLFR